MNTFALDICADCPCCQEGSIEGEFYCQHPDKPEEAVDPVPLFDGVPKWCPIRLVPLVVTVRV